MECWRRWSGGFVTEIKNEKCRVDEFAAPPKSDGGLLFFLILILDLENGMLAEVVGLVSGFVAPPKSDGGLLFFLILFFGK